MNFAITGASTGIGYQVALRLAAEGNAVFAIARRKQLLEKLRTEILTKTPDARIHLLDGDITDAGFQQHVAEAILQKEQCIQVLIHNAGTLINKPFEQLTTKDWMRVYSTNVFAVADLTRNLLGVFSKTGQNHILNISSMGGFQGSAKFKGLSAYSSSKAALGGITECLAEEFKDRNISVNCLCMGSVETEMFAAAFPGFKAASTAADAARFIAGFAKEGAALFNGKVLPVSNSTP